MSRVAVPRDDVDQPSDLLRASADEHSIAILDPAFAVVLWGRAIQEVTAYPADAVDATVIAALVGPDEVERARGGHRVEVAGWRVRRDGARFWAEVALAPIAGGDHADGPAGFALVIRDGTPRHTAVEAIRQSEQRYRQLVDGVSDYAIAMLDGEGRIATWNAGGERILGYRATEIVGHHLSRFYAEADVQTGTCARVLETAARDGRDEDEAWYTRQDGSRFWANTIVTALRAPTGDLLGFGAVIRDQTDRRLAEEERLRLGQAHEAMRLRDEFMSIASHELKTPLTAVQLQLQSLLTLTELDARARAKAERALRGAERLIHLSEALLDVARIATGRFVLATEPADLAAIVTQAVDDLRAGAAAAGCELAVRVLGPIEGLWDSLRAEQIVMNLVGNAIKYAAGMPIEIELSEQYGVALLEVRDSGPGVRGEDVGRIFDRFERAASMRHYGGLGLGLYITREIARAHGGEATARNLPGGGAAFTVRMPVRPATQAVATSYAAGASP